MPDPDSSPIFCRNRETDARSVLRSALDRVALLVATSVPLIAAFGIAAATGVSVPDPTRPPANVVPRAVAVDTEITPQLASILVSRDRRVAVIDGAPRRVGDHVGAMRVQYIDSHRVVLVDAASTRRVELVVPTLEVRSK